jgi:hypothetical protein
VLSRRPTERHYTLSNSENIDTDDRNKVKKVLVFNHELFEDFLDFSPEAQCALTMRFRDASDLIDVVGWNPDNDVADTATFKVPLTDDLVEQLRDRRWDLAATNADRLDGVSVHEPIPADLLAEITVDRLAAGALDRVIGTYAIAVSEG